MHAAFTSYTSRHVQFAISDTQSTVTEKQRVIRTTEFFLRWHGFLDQLNVPSYRLEDVVSNTPKAIDTIRKIFQFAGLPMPTRAKVSRMLGNHQGKKTNARKHRAMLTWQELCGYNRDLAFQLWELALKYSYTKDYGITKPCEG